MDLALKDKTVWITGASGGIGREVAERFAREGCTLVLQGGSRFDELTAFVAAQAWHERALCLQADLARPEQVEALAERALERFGRIDVCVAVAGRWPREPQLLHHASVQRIERTVADNLLSAVWTSRAFLRQLERCGPRQGAEAAHGAALVLIGSTAGQYGERHHADYALAKAGLRGLMASLKNEIVLIDRAARVNLVEPGWTMTHSVRPELSRPDIVKRVVGSMALRQLGAASDVAQAVLYLASPTAARHVSGQIVSVSGGMEGRTLWSADEIDAERARRMPPS